MNFDGLYGEINKGALNSTFSLLYGYDDTARYLRALDGFKTTFGKADAMRIFSAPGRTEIGGNHTDHQRGCVVAGAIHLDAVAVVSKTDSGFIRIKSEGFDIDIVDLNDLTLKKEDIGHSNSIVLGIAKIMTEMGYKVGSFDAYTVSNVLKGSGLSSSAAFEVLVCTVINGLFCDGKIDFVTVAKIAQRAEREFFGKPCGLLDQMASASGGVSFIDFADSQNPLSEKLSFDTEKYGYTLCIVDTGGNHSDLTDDYAAVPDECFNIAKHFGASALRDVDKNEFLKEIGTLRKQCGDRAVLRALHFFAENDRAVKEKDAVKCGDINALLHLVNESGNSSFKYLQNVYSSKFPNEQGISLALSLTEEFLCGEGACRVHGGGFAGTVQVYVKNERFSEYKEYIERFFGTGSCVKLRIRPVGGYEIKF